METKTRILLVEDDASIRESLVELLSFEGYECAEADDGLTATEILARERFDLLISDFRMPRMNGVDLLKWCREHEIHFPVIFITANRELFDKEQVALKDCCAALLRKPIGIDELLQAVDEAMARAHKRDCGSGPLVG